MDQKGIVQIDGADVVLFCGEPSEFTLPITVVAGSGNLVVGSVLGRITASHKYAPYVDGHADGTEVARVILSEAIDATVNDVNTSAYVDAVFNRAALTGIDLAGEEDLQDRGIFVKDLA